MRRIALWLAVAGLTVVMAAPGGAETRYKLPPPEIVALLDAAPTPVVNVSPDGAWMLRLSYPAMPGIADMARPMLRLAGMRIDPAANDQFRTRFYTGIEIESVADQKVGTVRVPPGARIAAINWSHDSARFAFTNSTSAGLELWVGDAAAATTKRLGDFHVNGVTGGFSWMPGSKSLFCWLVPRDRGRAPAAALGVPTGPNIQETAGRSAPVSTFQDLLRTEQDGEVFAYYATSQLARVDAASGGVTQVGAPGIYRQAQSSPNSKYLLVSRVHKPFSFLVSFGQFAYTQEVWDANGEKVFTVAESPAAENVPIGGVPTGPRGIQWEPQQDATLYWVEALDGGDPKQKVPQRDVVKELAAPFTGAPRDMAKTTHRFAGLSWVEGSTLALLGEYDRDRQWSTTWLLDTRATSGEPTKVWDLSINDAYGDPGNPELRRLPTGGAVIRRDGSAIFLTGQGAGAAGLRPFLDRFDLGAQQAQRLFQCAEGTYESVVAIAKDGFITSFETTDLPPNYRLHSLKDGAVRAALTDFPDPNPQLKGVTKQLLTYQRADGVQLSATLYLPPGYQSGTRLPVVFWAYPLEYTDPGTAGQVRTSPYRFTRVSGPSHLLFLLQGYAVLDGPALPVVGDPETMNDTYIEQIVAGAQAAIDKVVAMGVADRDRIGVGGHSYGAFMTANLLAHSDLFRAGCARSGAYNRTLTPFGFQSERRTFWQAPGTYMAMSPFASADKINEPLLLIHGEADNNSGTFPIQSERLLAAMTGLGGTARLVMLPNEAHGYAARESILDCLAEMLEWFDKYVKNAQPRQTAPAPSR